MVCGQCDSTEWVIRGRRADREMHGRWTFTCAQGHEVTPFEGRIEIHIKAVRFG